MRAQHLVTLLGSLRPDFELLLYDVISVYFKGYSRRRPARPAADHRDVWSVRPGPS
jgi:hypothetical protein